MIESLEGTFRSCLFQLCATGRDTDSYIRWLRAPLSMILNVPRDEASTTHLGNLCQCFITLTLKKAQSNMSEMSSVLPQTALVRFAVGFVQETSRKTLLKIHLPLIFKNYYYF